MHNHKIIKYTVLAAIIGLGWAALAAAQDVSVTLMPVRYASVKGDVSKFQTITGIKAGTSSGIEELTIDKKFKDIHLTFEGGSIPKEFDNDGHLLITKDNVGYVKVDYKSLRRYYDGHGGYFPYNYSTGPDVYGLPDDLHKDVSWFGIEIGNKTPDDTNLSFSFERLEKRGSEDSLTWASVYERIAATNYYKKVAPSLVKLNETTDTLSLNEKVDTIGNFTIKGKQNYEFVEGSKTRTEHQYTYPGDATASDSKIRVQNILPQTKILTSSVRAERWSLNDKTFFSAGYLFAHSRDTEIETTREYSSNWVWIGYSNPENKNGYGVNTEDKNVWTSELMTELFPALTVASKFKAELSSRSSSSQQDVDSLTGTTITSFATYYTNNALVRNRITKTGESISLRYNGISRVSLYSDIDLEQQRNWISEKRSSVTVISGSSSTIAFENDTNTPKLVETVGARFMPFKTVTITTDFKHSASNAKYDNIYNLTPTAEYFLSRLEMITNEANAKLAWKPNKWIQNSFAYKEAKHNYRTRFYNQDWQESQSVERDFNDTITLQPIDQLMFNLGYSVQLFKASTPASGQPNTSNVYIYVPTFTGNVYTWSFTTSLIPKENLTFFNTISYSRAKNNQNNAISNSVTAGAFSYGIDNEWWNSTLGIRWSPKKDLSIEPHYAYYTFRSNEGVDVGNYSAHVLWLEAKLSF